MENITIDQVKTFIKGNPGELDLLCIIALCAVQLTWNIGIEKEEPYIRGMMIGTQDYIDKYAS